MLATTPPPWRAEHISRTMLHVFGPPERDGFPEVVCIVDGTRREGNSALITAAPDMMAAVLVGDLEAARAALTSRGLA